VEDNTRRTFLATSLAGLAATATAAADGPASAVEAAVAKAVAECRSRADDRHMEGQVAYGKALVARFGEGVVAAIQETTATRARSSLQSATVAQRDLDAVKALLWDRLGERFQVQLVERTPRTLKFRVTRCPYAERMRQLDAAKLGFAYYCAYDIGFCEGLNPAIRFSRTKTLMMGDDCCDHSYTLDTEPSGA
jgi:predicted ArsR family transcriptional regulator